MASEVRNIPILDLKPEVDALWPQLSVKLEEVLRSGMFILGPETKSFETEVAEFLGVKHAIGCNSGTDALIIGLRALNIGPGDEVITTPFSFFATAESISLVGAKPVFVDVELDSMNIDPSVVEQAITANTKAIMPVHLFGRPANMKTILDIAKRHGLKVIEDCAQSFGAVDPSTNTMTGGIGEIGAFSFYPTKNLGAYGDAGLMTTNDDNLAELCRKLRTHGSLKQYHNEMLGYNSRLDSIQAAILRIKLPLIHGYNEARRNVALRYATLLNGVPEVVVPEVTPGHVFHQYTIRLIERDRDAVQIAMKDRGVGTMVYYPIPQDRLPIYQGQYPTYPTNEILSQQVLSLPIFPHLTADDQAYVANALKESVL